MENGTGPEIKYPLKLEGDRTFITVAHSDGHPPSIFDPPIEWKAGEPLPIEYKDGVWVRKED